MRLNSGIIIGLAFLVGALGVNAGKVYKSVDEAGTVVYSDRPLSNLSESSEVDLPAGPSEEERRSAEARVDKMQETADKMSEQRGAPVKERSGAEAKAAKSAQSESETVVRQENVDRRPRPNPLERVPGETPGGGQHPVYSPGAGAEQPVQLPTMPALPPTPSIQR
ncbi:MAG: DUF4124 domain-containing protein [Pseudomonadota bacterium]